MIITNSFCSYNERYLASKMLREVSFVAIRTKNHDVFSGFCNHGFKNENINMINVYNHLSLSDHFVLLVVLLCLSDFTNKGSIKMQITLSDRITTILKFFHFKC